MKFFSYYVSRPHHILYHPHQGFWNHISRKFFITSFIGLVLDNIRIFFLSKFIISRTNNVLDAKDIIWIDLGLHTHPTELLFAHKNFKRDIKSFHAFEANPDYFPYKSLSNTFYNNYAVVNSDKTEINLNITGHGLGSSISNIENISEQKKVPTIRLSKYIKNNYDLKKTRFIFRMNIEGAEYQVLTDLLNNTNINFQECLFLGTYDDVWKINPKKDLAFQRFLKLNKVVHFPLSEAELRPRNNAVTRALLKIRVSIIKNLIIRFINISKGINN